MLQNPGIKYNYLDVFRNIRVKLGYFKKVGSKTLLTVYSQLKKYIATKNF